ncbi:hypothetical protein [Halopiger thermotolerans]
MPTDEFDPVETGRMRVERILSSTEERTQRHVHVVSHVAPWPTATARNATLEHLLENELDFQCVPVT